MSATTRSAIRSSCLPCSILHLWQPNPSRRGSQSDKRASGDRLPQQLNGYNLRDIDAFRGDLIADYQDLHQGGEMVMSGHEQLRAQYGKIFTESPKLHCQIANRIKVGDFVVDHERVTGRPRGEAIEVVAIYELKNGLIERVWFAK